MNKLIILIILFPSLVLSFTLLAQDGAPVSKACSPGIFSQLLLDTTGVSASFGLPFVWRYEEFSVPEYDEFSDRIADNVYYGDGNLFYNFSFEGHYTLPFRVKPSFHLYIVPSPTGEPNGSSMSSGRMAPHRVRESEAHISTMART